jgi:uncharacterized protein YegP (UPF0339 family)
MKATFYTDGDGEHRWRLDANNHEQIGASTEGYHNLIDCRTNFHQVTGAIYDDSKAVMVRPTFATLFDLEQIDTAIIEAIEVEGLL